MTLPTPSTIRGLVENRVLTCFSVECEVLKKGQRITKIVQIKRMYYKFIKYLKTGYFLLPSIFRNPVTDANQYR